jgi:hypothetical protein
MFSLREKFEFLDDGIDFPFYNDVPKLSKLDWSIVFLGIILAIFLIWWGEMPQEYLSVSLFLVTTIPALYICKGNYGLLFKKIRLKDFKIIILCFIAYYVYSLSMELILWLFHYPLAGDAVLSVAGQDLFFYVTFFLQIMGEELYKILIFLFLLFAVYKLSGNRSLGIGIAIIGTVFIFGISHYSAYNGKILQILLIEGLGAIFNLYAYFKTKNVFASYIVHLLIDMGVFIIPLLQSLNM